MTDRQTDEVNYIRNAHWYSESSVVHLNQEPQNSRFSKMFQKAEHIE